jgi:hypothetical protein
VGHLWAPEGPTDGPLPWVETARASGGDMASEMHQVLCCPPPIPNGLSRCYKYRLCVCVTPKAGPTTQAVPASFFSADHVAGE